MNALEQLMAADALRVERARARVFAALGLPDVLDDGAARDVDLERAWFTASRDGEVAFAGPCRVVGVREADASWRWATDLDAAIAGVGAQAANGDDGLALRFATWIALRGGFVGAYPVEVAGAHVMLAVTLARGGADGDEARRWCSACGRASEGAILEHDDVALCASCVDDLRSLGEADTQGRVVFEGTARTPRDLLTLRAALGASASVSLTEVGSSARLLDALRALCLVCGRARARADVLVLNDAFTICPKCAAACANPR